MINTSPPGTVHTSANPVSGDDTSVAGSAVGRFLTAICNASFADDGTSDLYLNTARLDATVPGWRFAVDGADNIRAEYSRWFPASATMTELTRHTTESGEVIEYVLDWNEGEDAFRVHHAHVLTVDRDADRITEDRVWCGGKWTAALVSEMGAG